MRYIPYDVYKLAKQATRPCLTAMGLQFDFDIVLTYGFGELKLLWLSDSI